MNTKIMIIRYAGFFNHETNKFDHAEVIARPVSMKLIELLERDFSRIESIELVDMEGAELELTDETDGAVKEWRAIRTYMETT